MLQTLQLIVGLGNPGPRYQATRHNVGFWYVDQIAQSLGLNFRHEARFQALLAEYKTDGRVYRLLKPQAFMNLSGTAVQACAHFYKIPHDAILIAHDELDLACGSIKLKWAGGHAGHNGLKDIHNKLSTADYWRLRIGIDHPRHHHGQAVADYVLSPPDKSQQAAILEALDQGQRVLPDLFSGHLAHAQQQLNR